MLNDFGIANKSGGNNEVVLLRCVVVSSTAVADGDILAPFLILYDLLGYVVEDSVKLSDDVELFESFIVFTVFFRLLLFLINRFFIHVGYTKRKKMS